MTPTNEQIIVEANQRRKERGMDGLLLADFIIEVMREGWTPPAPVVDPDVLAFREWAAKDWVERYPAEVDDVQRGKRDGCDIAKAFVAGARMAREKERERAKVLLDYAWEDVGAPGGDEAKARSNRAFDIITKYEKGDQ